MTAPSAGAAPASAEAATDALPRCARIGEARLKELRARACERTLRYAPLDGSVDERLTKVLEAMDAFDRKWCDRLLPNDADTAATPAGVSAPPTAAATTAINLDPTSAQGAQRLQAVWLACLPEFLVRGSRLRRIRDRDDSIAEYLAEVYLIAAQKWPTFVYDSDEKTIRWLLSILKNLARRRPRPPAGGVVQRWTEGRERELATEQSLSMSASYSIDRIGLMALILETHERLPVECRFENLAARLHGLPTLQLLMLADTLRAVGGLNAKSQQLWGQAAIRHQSSKDIAANIEDTVVNVDQRFKRIRAEAIVNLVGLWAAGSNETRERTS